MRYHDDLILFWQFSLENLRKNMRDYTHKSWRWFQPISLMFQILWSTKFPSSPIFCKVGALPDCPGWWVYPCSPSDRDGGQLASVVWSFPIHFVQPFFEKEFHRMKLEFGCHGLNPTVSLFLSFPIPQGDKCCPVAGPEARWSEFMFILGDCTVFVVHVCGCF